MSEVQRITVDLDRIIEKTNVTMATALNEFLNRLSLEVVQATPVRTGRLRASWFLSPTLTAVATNEAEITPGAPAQTFARLGGQARNLADLDGSMYLLNGANYAMYVEARTQFFRKVLARAPVIAEDTMREIQALTR